MRSKSVLLSISLVAICAIVLSGCGGEMQVVRAPFISPVVVPAPEQFKMNAVVKNGSKQQEGGWELFVYTEYGPPGQFNHSNQRMFPVPTLSPDNSWALTDFDVTSGDTKAPCLKGQCEGHSWLVLCPYAASAWNACGAPNIYNNPQKCVHVWWQPGGNLADMRVKDC